MDYFYAIRGHSATNHWFGQEIGVCDTFVCVCSQASNIWITVSGYQVFQTYPEMASRHLSAQLVCISGGVPWSLWNLEFVVDTHRRPTSSYTHSCSTQVAKQTLAYSLLKPPVQSRYPHLGSCSSQAKCQRRVRPCLHESETKNTYN